MGGEEVGADGGHRVDIDGLHQLLPQLGFVATSAGSLGGHHETGAAVVAQVAEK